RLAIGFAAIGEILAGALNISELDDGLGVAGTFGNGPLEKLLGVVGTIERVEVHSHLNLGVAREHRVRRYPLIGLDREVRLFQLLVKIAERKQRHRMRRLQIKRELQIDQRQVFAAATADRGAEAIKRFRGAGLW